MNQPKSSNEGFLGDTLLEKMDLQSLIYPLWANKILVILITTFCLMIGFIYGSAKPPLYSSNVLLQFEDQGNLLGLDKELGSMSFLSPKGSSNADIQTVLLRSRYILEPVIQKLHLDIVARPKRFPFIGGWYANRNTDPNDKPWWGSPRYAWGGEKIQISQFKVPPSEENRSFILVASGENQFELYDQEKHLILRGVVGKEVVGMLDSGPVTLTVAKLEAGMNTEFKLIKNSSQQMVDSLSRQLDIKDLSQDMKISTRSGVLKASLTGPDPKYLVKVLNTISEIAVEKNARKKTLEATKTIAFINQQLPLVKKSLDEAESKLSQYLAKEGMIDLNSESKLLLDVMTKTQESLSFLRMNKAAALRKYTPAHPFIVSLTEKEQALTEELNLQKKKLSELPSRDQVVLSLMRDVTVKNQLYILLLNKIQSLEVTKGGTISDLTILGAALPPDRPLPSQMPLTLALSFFMGLLLSASFIYLLKIWNRKINDPAIIENRFGLPNVAIIPYSEKQHQVLKTYNPKKKMLPLLAMTDPKDLSIEALRGLRTSSQFSLLNGARNVISITGIAPGVGKSFVSVNFAYLHADSRKRVLLIDGDLRKGHLKDYFKVGSVAGLSEVICGTSSFEEAVIKGPIETLDFIATGVFPPNPSELLMSLEFKNLLDKASKEYDLVIIDTPPILAVTDAVLIAKYAGANFLVLASNTHVPAEVELALKRLSNSNISMNGVVFNISKQQKGLYKASQISSYQYQYEYK